MQPRLAPDARRVVDDQAQRAVAFVPPHAQIALGLVIVHRRRPGDLRLQPGEREVAIEVDRPRATHVRVEKRRHVATADRFHGLLDRAPVDPVRCRLTPRWGRRDRGHATEQQPHHVVHRLLALRGVANHQVQYRAGQLALEMSARAIIAQLSGLGVVRHLADRFRGKPAVGGIEDVTPDQPFEMRGAGRVVETNSGAPQQQVGVVHRQPFAEPQAPNRRLRAIAEVLGLDRPDCKQVPGVEELMCGFRQDRIRVLRQIRARRAHRDRVVMLEPATVSAVLEQERVLAVRSATEQCEGLVHDALNSRDERRGVERRRGGERPIDHAVRRRSFDKAPLAQMSDEDRGVDERRRVLGGVAPHALPRSQNALIAGAHRIAQAGRHHPAGRELERYGDRLLLATQQKHECVRPTDEPARRSKERTP